MDIQFFDRLYGTLQFNQHDVALFQTEPMRRLRHVSHTAIPTWLLPTSVCSSKFEHSLGCGHLARLTATEVDVGDYGDELYVAALLHDVGTPPFSHASENFLEKVLGYSHEEFAGEFLQDKSLLRVLKERHVDIETIFNFINGESLPYGKLINGDIDIDNLDNTLRFGVSMGLIDNAYYDPQVLAKSYTFKNGHISLQVDSLQTIRAWEQCRKDVYDFIYSSANLASGMMLDRALDFAYQAGELTRNYFSMHDEAAFEYLLTKTNKKTRSILELADRWVFYQQLFSIHSSEPSDKLKLYASDIDYRTKVSNQLADLLQVNHEEIAVFFRVDKGHKELKTQLLDTEGNSLHYKQQSQKMWICQVYAHPSLIVRQAEVEGYMNELLQD